MRYLICWLLMLALYSCSKKDYGNPIVSEPMPKHLMVSTVAGEGLPGFKEGNVLTARFAFPEDVGILPDGSILVTDVVSHRIRRIADATVSSLAGNEMPGIIDGVGSLAAFIFPYSITVDKNGIAYSTDDNDPRVRKISSTGAVNVYVGNANSGFIDGISDVARFGAGNYLTSDGAGNLYISDGHNNSIRKVSPEGIVSTFAGTGLAGFSDGQRLTSLFSNPAGIAIDQAGNIFIADRGNFRIRKISSTGQVSTLAGSGVAGTQDGGANSAQFSPDMRDLVIDKKGNLYLSELDKIRKISADGIVSTIAGSVAGFSDGQGNEAKFNYPNGMCIDQDGNIYVADTNNHSIRKLSWQ